MSNKVQLPSARRAHMPLAGLALAALALAGCEHEQYITGPQVAGWSLVDPSQRHPIIVSEQPQSMEIRVGSGQRGLTGEQRQDVLRFADRARASDAGNSRLVISAPGGSTNEVASMYAVSDIRQILSDYGFAESSIAVEAYNTGRSSGAPIKISYLRYVAEAPPCGAWPTNLAHEPFNLPYPNFGCANQHNLAAMIANPADLMGPRTESDRSGERRDVVWDKYVKGESSNAQKSADEKISTKSN